jgi:glycosyltransferase involved in cell wall biosynthesis
MGPHTKPLRILILVHGYPPTHRAGAELRAERTAQALLRRQYEVRVLAVESFASRDQEVRFDDRLQDGVWIRRAHFNLAAAPDPFVWSYDNPLLGAAVADCIAEWQPHIVHLYSGYILSASSVRAARAANVPLVLSVTDYWWLCHRIVLLRPDGSTCDGPSPMECARCLLEVRRRYRLPRIMWPAGTEFAWQAVDALNWFQPALQRQAVRSETLRSALEDVSLIIAPSQYIADVYIRFGADPSRVRVIRQGTDLVPLESLRVVRGGARRAELRVGYIGQMKRHKGVDTLLEAWPKLRGPYPRRLLLYGSTEGEPRYARQLQRALAELPTASWEGAFQRSELAPVLAGLDVLVVPSRWAENSPNVILEAHAAGVPVVGARIGGIPELVSHGRNGLLFQVNNSDDLTHQLQCLLEEPGLLPSLRSHIEAGPSTADELDRLCELYDEVAPAGRSQHRLIVH